MHGGRLDVAVDRVEVGALPELDVDLMLNVGNPEQAFSFAALPNAGVGLARMEFVVSRQIGCTRTRCSGSPTSPPSSGNGSRTGSRRTARRATTS